MIHNSYEGNKDAVGLCSESGIGVSPASRCIHATPELQQCRFAPVKGLEEGRSLTAN